MKTISGAKRRNKEGSIKPYGEVNLTLIYGPEASVIPPETVVNTIRIDESDTCGELHAIVSPAADVDIYLYVGYAMYDSLGIFIGGETPVEVPPWIIPAGSTTSDFTVLFDCADCGGGFPAGGCWALSWTSRMPTQRDGLYILFSNIQTVPADENCLYDTSDL